MNCEDCTESDKRRNGCINDAIGTIWEFEGEKFKRCPVKMVNKINNEWIEAYNWYCKGFLPIVGGMLNQTNRFLDLISVIDNCLSDRGKKDGQ